MKALICENLQNNYFEGGIEECKDAEQCIPVINQLLTKFDLIIFTKDWSDLIADSPPSDFYRNLDLSACKKDFYIFKKEYDSAFRNTELEEFLKERKVDELYICGVPIEHSILSTAVDAKKIGFKTTVIEDACKSQLFNNIDVLVLLGMFEDKNINVIKSKEINATS